MNPTARGLKAEAHRMSNLVNGELKDVPTVEVGGKCRRLLLRKDRGDYRSELI